MVFVDQQCKVHGYTQHKMSSNGAGRNRIRVCVQCLRARQTAVRRAKKAKLVALMGGGCAVCGYNRVLAALDFHHSDPAKKSHAMSRMQQRRKMSDCVVEVQKCILLCKNCHTEYETGFTDTVRLVNDLLTIRGLR